MLILWGAAAFQGLFGNTAASQPSGLFGAAQTSTATGFGAGTGLFSHSNTAFGNMGTQVERRVSLIFISWISVIFLILCWNIVILPFSTK